MQYGIIFGERRFRASVAAGKQTIPAIIRDKTDAQVVVEQLIENLQREDLDPIEKAEGLRRALELTDDAGKKVYTQGELAKVLGLTQPTIAILIGLLDLPEPVRAQVSSSAHKAPDGERGLSPSHARVLVPFGSYPWILEAVQKCIEDQELPPAKEFPEFVHNVLVGYAGSPPLIRPMTKSQYPLGNRCLEFNPATQGHPRDWSQLPDYRHQLVQPHRAGEHPHQKDPGRPGPGSCEKCPHQRTMSLRIFGPARELAVCMLSACWDGKQKVHRAGIRQGTRAQVGKLATDPTKLDRADVVRREHRELTRDPTGMGYGAGDLPLFSVTSHCKKCPIKVDGLPAYREAFRKVLGQIKPAGAVCLAPKHFAQLQEEAVGERLGIWMKGTVAMAKGIARRAASGFSREDLARLTLELLDGGIECKDLGHAAYSHRVPLVKIFCQAFGLKTVQLRQLMKADRRILETYAKYAWEVCRESIRRPSWSVIRSRISDPGRFK